MPLPPFPARPDPEPARSSPFGSAALRIALLLPRFGSEAVLSGGSDDVEAFVRAQARELARLGHDVLVVAGTGDPHAGNDVIRTEEDGLQVARIPRQASEQNGFAPIRPRIVALVREALRDRDVAHVHHWVGLAGGLVRGLAPELPVVLSLHDHFASCPRSTRRSPVPGIACPPRHATAACASCLRDEAAPRAPEELEVELRERWLAYEAEIAAAALVLVPSRAHLDRLRESVALPEDRVRILRDGAIEPFPGPAAASGSGYDGRRPLRVLHTGPRSADSGVQDLVEALARVPSGSVELTLVGRETEPGFDKQLLDGARRLRIAFLAPASARADLAAFPVRIRASRAPEVEAALASGLPVWLSDRSAGAELVAPAGAGRIGPGRILPAEDPGAWADAFRRVIAFPMMLDDERKAIPVRTRTAVDAARDLEAWYQALRSQPTGRSTANAHP